MNPTLAGYLWCALASVASAGATFLIKSSSNYGSGISLMRLLWLGGACTAYVAGFVCYAFALEKMAITLAYPVMTAITIFIVTILGVLLLQESLTPVRLLGLLLIGTGVFFVSR